MTKLVVFQGRPRDGNGTPLRLSSNFFQTPTKPYRRFTGSGSLSLCSTSGPSLGGPDDTWVLSLPGNLDARVYRVP